MQQTLNQLKIVNNQVNSCNNVPVYLIYKQKKQTATYLVAVFG